jgi:dTDP-4-amino-4,6-dideoxygalactose transaminase
MIPMVDLKAQYHDLKADIDAAVLAVLENTQFILGPNVTTLEKEISDYLSVKHAITCASGTDALHLALAAADIGPGDQVITTAFTFIATAEAIRYVGAEPVFVDIDPQTFNLDPQQVRAAITPKTKAVIAVHLFGQPARIPELSQLCQEHKILFIEDCAQSFGATVGHQQTGTFGEIGCFSFFPSKNLGGFGDGGLVTTQSDHYADRIKMLRNHGSQIRYHHDVIGYNSRLDELQAAILRVKLKHIERFNENRRRVAHRYSEQLQGVGVVTPYEDTAAPQSRHVYHQYTLLSDRRDQIMDALKAANVASAVYYPIPLHRQKAFAGCFDRVSLPVTERVSQQCFSLPIYPEMTNTQVDFVADVVRNAA